MKNVKIILILVALSVACSKGTDPKKDYSGVNTVPKNNETNPNQDVSLSPFTFKMISTSDIGVATFTAGKKGGGVQFEVKPASQVTKYTVEAILKPEGSTFEKVSDNIFILKWNPDQNESQTKVPFQMRATVVEATEQRKVGSGDSEVFMLYVDKQNNQPKILGIDGLKGDRKGIPVLTMGETVHLTIHGEDPLANPQNPPDLIPFDCETGNNIESPKSGGRRFIEEISTTHIQGTNRFDYRRDLILDSPVIRDSGNNEGFELCIGFKMFVDGRSSGLVTRNIRVMYKASKPQISVSPVTLGKSFDLQIEVTVPGREVGKLEVTTTEINPANFPGESKLEENGASANSGKRNAWTKVFRWSPSAEAVDKDYSLKIDAVHTVMRNGKPVEAKETKTVTFKVSEKNIKRTPVKVGPK